MSANIEPEKKIAPVFAAKIVIAAVFSAYYLSLLPTGPFLFDNIMIHNFVYEHDWHPNWIETLVTCFENLLLLVVIGGVFCLPNKLPSPFGPRQLLLSVFVIATVSVAFICEFREYQALVEFAKEIEKQGGCVFRKASPFFDGLWYQRTILATFFLTSALGIVWGSPIDFWKEICALVQKGNECV